MADGATRATGNTKHPLLREAGNKIFMSLDRPEDHPGGVISPGNIAANTNFPLLVGGNMTVANTASGNFQTQVDGSILVAGSSLIATNAMRFGAAGAWDQSAAPFGYILGLWAKLPASGYTTTNYMPLIRNTSGAIAEAQAFIDMGLGGLIPRFAVKGVVLTSPIPVTPGQKFQVFGQWVPGEFMGLYLNGILVASTTVGVPSTLIAAPAAFLEIPNSLKAQIYAMTYIDTLAAETFEAAIPDIPPDWLMTAAEYIARDYAVRTGAFAGAPGFALP